MTVAYRTDGIYTSNSSLGDEGVQELSREWGKDENLTTLNLASSDLGVAGVAALAAALRASFSIASVDCSGNSRLGDEGVALLTPALLTDGMGASTIRELNLVRCSVGDPGATALAKALPGNSVLEQLKLSGNFIGDAGAVGIMNSLLGLTKGFLTHLWLGSNRIGSKGAEAMAIALAKSPMLQELHLSGNALGNIGVAALVRGAVAGKCLRGLYVGGCGLGDTGARQVANALAGSLYLETLHLGYNTISDEGGSSLARALAENRALKRLMLPANLLREAGGKAVAGMLISNETLLHLDISGNRLGATGIEAVATAIAKNTTLLELSLSECGGTDAAFRSVAKAVEANDSLGCLLYDGNHLNVDVLAEVEYSMSRAKRSVRALLEQVQRSMDRLIREADTASRSIPTEGKSKDALPSVQLAPGQETSVAVAMGRRDNIIGSISVTSETTLEEARGFIDPLLQIATTFQFVSNIARAVPFEEERARRVVWDCEVPVRLRPESWVPIGRT